MLRGFGENFFNLYMLFSELSPLHSTQAATLKWDTFPTNPTIGMGTLHFKAQRDNPSRYADFRKRSKSGCLEAVIASRGSHASVAKLFLSMYPGVFKNTDDRDVSLYNFHEHRWNSGGRARIISLLVDDVAPSIRSHATSLKDRTTFMLDDNPSKARLIKQQAVLSRVADNLENQPTQEKLIKEIGSFVYDSRFEKTLNECKSIIGFDNGVFDLEQGQFRQGLSEDARTFSAGYDFATEDDLDVQADILHFFYGMFPNQHVAEYRLNIIATCLHGHRTIQKLFFESGTGNNGNLKQVLNGKNPEDLLFH